MGRVASAAALALLVGLAPGFRGLYFAPQQLAALLVACVLAGAVWVVRPVPDGRLLRLPVDGLALALVGAYLLALAVAVRPEAALQQWLVVSLCWLAFWSAGELALGWGPGRGVLLHGLLLGGVAVTGTALAGAAGLWPANSWFVAQRLYSSLQYPDAAGAYLGAMALLAQGLRSATAVPWLRVLYGGLGATYLFGFVFTLSRGAELVFVPVLALWLVLLGRRRLVDGLAGLAVAAAATAAGSLPYVQGLHAAAGGPPGLRAVSAAAAMLWAVAVALGAAWEGLRALPGRWRGAALAGTAAAAGAALAVAAGALRAHLPALGSALGRLGQLSLQDYNAWSRLQWTRDAWRMFLQRPLLGWGGGGWAAAYRAFQSYDYSSTQVHDAWLQTGVEAGALGLACWLALWAAVVWCGIVAYRRGPAEDRPLAAGLGAAVLMLLGHGLIDFTLSLAAVSLALWTAAGLLRAEAVQAVGRVPAAGGARRARDAGAAPGGFWAAAALYGGLVCLGTVGLLELSGIRQVQAGARLGNAGALQKALPVLQAAAATAPWSADAYLDLAVVEQALGQQLLSQGPQAGAAGDAALAHLQQADAAYRRALALDRLDAAVRLRYARLLQAMGNGPAAVEQYRLAQQEAIYDPSTYSALAVGLVDAAAGALQARDQADARRWLEAVPAVATQMRARYEAIPPQARAHSTFPASDPGVQLALGEAAAIEGRWADAAAALTPLVGQQGQIGAEANLWLAEVEQKQGRPSAASHLQAAERRFGALPADQGSYAAQKAIADRLVGGLA